jgi:uncharacterized SAM-binding protein YcdF (DUF218 family)
VFLLSKILPLFVLPLGIIIGCLILGIVRRKRWPVVIAVALLWVSSMPGVARTLMRSIEGGMVRLTPSDVPEADAIVVLSGGRVVAPGPNRVSEWSDADRFFGGLDLIRAQKAPLLVFTGGIVTGGANDILEGDTMMAQAIASGVAADRVVTTGRVVNTAEEAAAVASLLHSRGLAQPKVLLVTSAYHLPRARRLFEAQGLTIVPFPVDFSGSGVSSLRLLDLVPVPGSFHQTHLALRELYGRLYYSLPIH